MKREFDLLKVTRQNILKIVQNYSDEQLVKIPQGFNNNILWNVGHVINSSEKLTYALAGLKCNIPDAFQGLYGKGTDPKLWNGIPDVKLVKEFLISSPELLEADYQKGLFKDYKEYPTSYGYNLKSIEDAIMFNNVHESLHLGYIMALRKLV